MNPESNERPSQFASVCCCHFVLCVISESSSCHVLHFTFTIRLKKRLGDGADAWDVRTLDAELEVQRTIKRAELIAFLCLVRKAVDPTVVHVDNKGIIDGLWREKRNALAQKRRMQDQRILIWEEVHDMKCIGPRAKVPDLWILTWEELHSVHREGTSTSNRTAPKKEIQQMSLFKKVHRRRK